MDACEIAPLTRSKGPVEEEMVEGDEDENKEEFEREERKQRLRKKEKALFEELRKSQAMSSVQPLGSDRIFRRYWLFNAIRGLFIEKNDPDVEKLLQPIAKEEEVRFK